MALKGNCYVIGAGEMYQNRPFPLPGDFVIAVDGGYAHLQRMGLEADLLIGDFDSLPEVPLHPHVISLCREKDDTDMLAALREGLKQGYRKFYLFGGTGKRMDHTLANLQALAMLVQEGAYGVLFGEQESLMVIGPGTAKFSAEAKGYVSVFAFSQKAVGVSEQGLKYTLDKVELFNTFPLGVSNEFIGQDSRISLEKGMLLVVYPHTAEIDFEEYMG